MAASSYGACLTRLLAHEGGYTNHPADPGGPTNFGITVCDAQKYAAEFGWILGRKVTAADVKAMPLLFAKQVYKAKYWDRLRCDELPAGIDYATFDYGVNSGVGRAGKVLRRCLHLSDASSRVTDDVIAAAAKVNAANLVCAICDERLAYLRSLKTWNVFGRGWSRRVAEVKDAALTMTAAPAPKTSPTPNRAALAGAAGASAGGAAHAAGLPLWSVLAVALFAALAVALAAHLIFTRKA
jgi:lysozyme family protein